MSLWSSLLLNRGRVVGGDQLSQAQCFGVAALISRIGTESSAHFYLTEYSF